MYIDEIDFFRGIGHLFAHQIMKITQERSYGSGENIFSEGDPARHLYILLTGSVRLSSGLAGGVVYIANRGGEAFGWSSLVGRESYSATAETMAPTRLHLFERDRFMALLTNDPENGLIIYKSLAMTLAKRLFESYKVISDALASGGYASQGSRQLEDMYE